MDLKSQSSTRSYPHLLDLPTSILEKILYDIAYEDRGSGLLMFKLPTSILPVATTCKSLRNITATVLSRNEQWITPLFTSCICFKNSVSCPHISDDLNKQVTSPDQTRCLYDLCSNMHRLVAWYRLAIPRLSIFAFSSIWCSLRAREATHLVQYIIQNQSPLKKLELRFPRDANVTHSSVILALDKLLPTVSSNIQTIVFSTAYQKGQELVDTLCSNPLPSLKYIDLFMEGCDPKHDIQLAGTFLQHCQKSKANILRLQLTASAQHLEKLPMLCTICSSIKQLELKLASYSNFCFPPVENMKNFKVESLKIKNATISEKQMNNLIDFILSHEETSQLHFEHTEIQSLSTFLDQHKQSLGKKIKSLDILTSDKYDRDFIQRIADYCHQLEQLWILCSTADVKHIRSILRRSAKLKVLHLKIEEDPIDKNCDMEDVALGLQECCSPIEKLQLYGPALNGDQLCSVVDQFSTTLKNFRLFSGDDDSLSRLKGLTKVFRHILNRNDMNQLRQFVAPVYPWPKGWTKEEESLLVEIAHLSCRMQTVFKNFDSSDVL